LSITQGFNLYLKKDFTNFNNESGS